MIKILGLIILILGLGVGVYLVLNQTGFFSRADASLAPVNLQVSNVSDNSFSVSWVTTKPTLGYVSYGIDEKLGSVTGDDRGQKEMLTHHVTLKNLNPNKTYYFKIISNSKIFDSNGKALNQKTAPVADNAPAVADPINGKVVKSNGSPSTEALVYLKFGNNSLLSSYTRSNGNWLITLNNARTADLKDYAKVNAGDEAEVIVSVGADGYVDKKFKIGDKKAVSKLTLGAGAPVNNTSLQAGGTAPSTQTTNPTTAPTNSNTNSNKPNQATKGVLDTADCNTISGWTCDPDDFNNSIDVHIYDGVAGVGKVVANGKANKERSDLKTAQNTCNGTTTHGFEFATPASLKDGKEHTIYAYGINTPASGEGNTQLWSSEVKKITCK